MITIKLEGLINVEELRHAISNNGSSVMVERNKTRIYVATMGVVDVTITVDQAIRRWGLEEFTPKYAEGNRWVYNYRIDCDNSNDANVVACVAQLALYKKLLLDTENHIVRIISGHISNSDKYMTAREFVAEFGTPEHTSAIHSCSFEEFAAATTKSIAHANDLPVSMLTANGPNMAMIKSDFIIYCKGFNKKIVFEVVNQLIANIKFNEERDVYHINNGCKNVRFMTADAFVSAFGTADQLEQCKAGIGFGNPFQVFNDDGLSNVNTSRQLYHQMIGRGLRTKDSVMSDHSLPSTDMTETLRRRSKLLLAESTYGLQSTKTMKQKQAAGKIAMANDLKSPNAAMIENDGVETQHVPTSKVMDESVGTGLRMIVNSDLLCSH